MTKSQYKLIVDPKPYVVKIRHSWAPDKRTAVNDLGAKLAARILLTDTEGGIVIPSREEMIGVALLERDDELPKRKTTCR